MTAVGYLIELLAKEKIALPDYIIKNAKQMEKQQIINAYEDGSYDSPLRIGDKEQYYNEKFKK